jgi:hypothetical protein
MPARLERSQTSHRRHYYPHEDQREGYRLRRPTTNAFVAQRVRGQSPIQLTFSPLAIAAR